MIYLSVLSSSSINLLKSIFFRMKNPSYFRDRGSISISTIYFIRMCFLKYQLPISNYSHRLLAFPFSRRFYRLTLLPVCPQAIESCFGGENQANWDAWIDGIKASKKACLLEPTTPLEALGATPLESKATKPLPKPTRPETPVRAADQRVSEQSC